MIEEWTETFPSDLNCLLYQKRSGFYLNPLTSLNPYDVSMSYVIRDGTQPYEWKTYDGSGVYFVERPPPEEMDLTLYIAAAAALFLYDKLKKCFSIRADDEAQRWTWR